MTRRSPLHDRYQGKRKRKGATGVSAARAKPKRDVGEASDSPAKKDSGSQAGRPTPPTSPEMKRLRWIWWGLMGLAVAAFAAYYFLPKRAPYLQYQLVPLGVYVAAIAAALYVEFVPLKRARAAAAAEQKKAAKSSKGPR